MFSAIKPSASEVADIVSGDDIVPHATVVMDRAFSLPAPPQTVWPWIVQLGKKRSNWYFSRRIEPLIFPKSRGLRYLEPMFQALSVGDVVPDWGGKDATFEVAQITPLGALVYKSVRGSTNVSWAIVLSPEASGTRIHFRLRLGPVRAKWLAESFGGYFDAVTIAWLAAGLRERVTEPEIRPAA